VSPEELAAKHPRLYHLAHAGALPSILRHGLLPTSRLLTLFELPEAERERIERRRRPARVEISHPIHSKAMIADNLPLSEKALASCLDDGLAPQDWLLMLNARVFFWPDAENLANHLGARFNRGRERLVLVFDTLGTVRQHYEKVELSAINSGSTIRKPARRGHSTFVPARLHGYEAWRRLRGGLDRLREVTVVGGVTDVPKHLIKHYATTG
jgi:hypothetical protein